MGAAPLHATPQASGGARETSQETPDTTLSSGVEARAVSAQLEAERRVWRAREAELLARIGGLEQALASEQQLRLAREQEWLEFTRVLTSLDLPAQPTPPAFLAEALAPSVDPVAAEEERARLARLARGREMRARLRALLSAEQVFSIDFLELGEPHVHQGRGAVGPIVARLTDDRGRLIGALAANHLTLEVSRAARTVTLVLSEGYETRSGQRVDFEGGAEARGGTRRIFLPSVDPAPWIETLPELVSPEDSLALLDDGRWDLQALRIRLNELLRRAGPDGDSGTSGGAGWRLRALGGVLGDSLCDVQLVEYADDGAVRRRLFADRMVIGRLGRAVELVLRDGSQERRGRVAPFLDGRYRVALPRAGADDWAAAGVPGLARPR